MKVGLIGVLQNPSLRMSSHNAGWTYVYKSMLEERYGCQIDICTAPGDWDDYDHLWINEGVNFRPGVYNLFGGVGDKLIERLEALADYEGQLFFWGLEAPNYQELCDKRNIDMYVVKDIIAEEHIINSNKLILGDSHTISVYQPGWHISRNDGHTLHSFSLYSHAYYHELARKYDTLRFYAGNIDIRHHICRLYDGIDIYEAIETLVINLYDRLSTFNNVEVVCPLWNPDDERKIPKTGYYKKQPFWGSWDAREEARAVLSMYLHQYFENVLTWPREYQNGNVLTPSVMEARQSVHLAPKAYMFSGEFCNK